MVQVWAKFLSTLAFLYICLEFIRERLSGSYLCALIQTQFVLLYCFSSPRQRPLSAAHPAWPLPVPTVYCDCHQAHGGPTKGGLFPLSCPGLSAPLWA